ncbi:S8 family serine peptidase [Halobacillus halophilus]|uniref:S8 family serine peptidase n=1 Tax=Halobacillus halophilus TaxID=1570 RepID=UPI001367B09D|nr:S8 family serine peptidase [Halobacillus halophilus]MYL30875.1 S8 family serine peptidase [Halobacillus halophilus]
MNRNYVRSIISVAVMFVMFSLMIPVIHAEEKEQVHFIVKYKEEVTSQSGEKSFPVDVVPVDKDQAEKKQKELKEDPDVEYIETDVKVYAQGDVPDDPFYSDQKKTFDAVHAEESWMDYKKVSEEDPVVAVIDSGMSLNHPDLEGQLIQGTNILEPSESPEDTFGHGTHVAGLIGAVTSNHLGVSSLSRGDVQMMPVKVMEAESGNLSDVIKGIDYAVEQGVDIINLSLGTYVYRTALADAIEYARQEGVIVVAAAGNDDREKALYPAALDQVISVGSYDLEDNEKASFSNYGPEVDVVTPGTDLYSTYLDDGYKRMGGTSMSSGHVSALAALVENHAPYLEAEQVQRLIVDGAETAASTYELGEGMINAEKTLNQVRDYQRISGAASVETSTAISKKGWDALEEETLTIDGEKEQGKFVILATGKDFPDSLAASPLASYLNSPVLLERRSDLSSSIKEELDRLNATDVIIIGGDVAVSADVENDVENEGYDVHRIKGSDRYETAVAVNELIPYETNKGFVVSGQEFPDALSASAYSGVKQYPILYVKQDEIPEVVQTYMEEEGITKNYIVGGTQPISEKVASTLPDAHPLRISGKNRYETNKAMHRTFGRASAETLYFSTGQNFPDAMAAAPLAVKTASPIILTNERYAPVTADSIRLFKDRSSYYIIGGTYPVPAEHAWEIDDIFYR